MREYSIESKIHPGCELYSVSTHQYSYGLKSHDFYVSFQFRFKVLYLKNYFLMLSHNKSLCSFYLGMAHNIFLKTENIKHIKYNLYYQRGGGFSYTDFYLCNLDVSYSIPKSEKASLDFTYGY